MFKLNLKKKEEAKPDPNRPLEVGDRVVIISESKTEYPRHDIKVGSTCEVAELNPFVDNVVKVKVCMEDKEGEPIETTIKFFYQAVSVDHIKLWRDV